VMVKENIHKYFNKKKQGKYDVKIELHRVQMRQLLVGSYWAAPLIEDYQADTNFRAVIELTIDDDMLPQSETHWALSNSYASKGTVSGNMTAKVLKGLNVLENKVMEAVYRKRTADTLVSLLIYLGHNRQLATGLLWDKIEDALTSFNRNQSDNESENQLAWGLDNGNNDIKHQGYVEVHQRYTYVLGREKKDPTEFQFVMALKTRRIGADDVYAKHGTLVDTEKYDVEAAGEMTIHYKEDNVFVICLDNDSGTFRPSIKHITRLKDLLQDVFAKDEFMKHYDWKVVVSSRPQLLPKKPEEGETNNKPVTYMAKEEVDLLLKNYDLYMSNSFPQASEQREDIVDITNAKSASDLGLAYS